MPSLRAWRSGCALSPYFFRKQKAAVIVEITAESFDSPIGDEQETVGGGFQQTPVMADKYHGSVKIVQRVQ